MLNVTSMVELQTCNVAVNYVELEIENAIRLYYQVFIALSGIVANVLALVVTLSKRMRQHSTCLYMSAISGSDALITGDQPLCGGWSRYVNTTSVWSCKLILFSFYYAIHLLRSRFWSPWRPSASSPFASRSGRTCTSRAASLSQMIVGVAMAILALDVHNLFTRTMLVNATTGRKMCLLQ